MSAVGEYQRKKNRSKAAEVAQVEVENVAGARKGEGGRGVVPSPQGSWAPNPAETYYSYCTYFTYSTYYTFYTYSTAETCYTYCTYSTAETYSRVRGSWAPRRASPTPCTPATAL